MPADAALLAARLLLAFIFLASGLSALGDIAGCDRLLFFARLSAAPSLVAWATGLFELVAGALIVVGFQTTAAALLLGGLQHRCWLHRPLSARAATIRRSPSCTARR